MGFLAGMVLAGVGGASAKTLLFWKKVDTHQQKNLEEYWSDSGVGLKELTDLISNSSCDSSEKYFLACVNSLTQNTLAYGLRLSDKTGQLELWSGRQGEDELTEKQRLLPFLDFYNQRATKRINFEQHWRQLLDLEKKDKRPILVANAINSFLSVYKDPHSYIMPDRYYDEVGSQLERSNLFVGLSFEKIDQTTQIRKVFKNSDADRAGLKEYDKLVSINGRLAQDLTLLELGQILRNENEKQFTIFVTRQNEIKKIKLERHYQSLSHVQFEMLNEQHRIGHLVITKFNRGVCEETAKKLKATASQNIEGLILDLRDNPGGQLDEAACLTGLFIGMNKRTYSVEFFDPLKSGEVVLSTGSLLYTGPLVVLQNSSSASAAELLAGALQIYKRALIIGETSFGKGTFQESEIWSKNSKVSLFRTQGYYLLPNKTSTQLVGVKPDLAVEDHHLHLRENNMYFNPLPGPEDRQDIFSEDSRLLEQRDYQATLDKCKLGQDMKDVSGQIMTDDLFLATALDVLACRRMTSALATQFNREDFN